MAERTPMSFIIIVGITAIISWLSWLTVSTIETDRTQDVVNNKIEHLMTRNVELLRDMQQIPNNFDDSDRWYRSEQLLYQRGVGIYNSALLFRIQRLEKFHPPESLFKYEYE